MKGQTAAAAQNRRLITPPFYTFFWRVQVERRIIREKICYVNWTMTHNSPLSMNRLRSKAVQEGTFSTCLRQSSSNKLMSEHFNGAGLDYLIS